MRSSEIAERYAQRAVNKRRQLEEKQRQERRMGDFALVGYLSEGAHLESALRSLSHEERIGYILKNSEMIASSDGAEGIHIVWGPNRAVLTHRLLTLEMRRQFNNKHYLKSWWRDTIFNGRHAIRHSMVELLEKRVNARREQAKQGVLGIDLTVEEIEAEAPQFLVDGDIGEEEKAHWEF